MGVVTPQAFPTYPHGFPHDVIDPFMNRTGRGVLGNKPASGTEIIQELGEEHQRTGKWIVYTSADSVFQIAAHEETIPLEELYAGCGVARELLTGKHAVGRVIARPFVGEPGNYERTPNRHDYSLEPKRPNYLTLVRDAGQPSTVSARSPTSSPAATSTNRTRRSRTSTASRTDQLLQELDSGLVFVNLVETDLLWGHRNDPVNFHRCLQDFDRRLPDILDALRPGDLLILTSDHGCDPTTPSTDHSREHALLLAYVEGRNAAGADPRGRVRRRRRDGERLARRQGAVARDPGHADSRAVRIDDPAYVREQYATEDGLAARASLYLYSGGGPDARDVVVEQSSSCGRAACSRSAPVGVSWPSDAASSVRGPRPRPVAAHGGAGRGRGVEAVVGDVRAAVRGRRVRRRRRGWMLYHVRSTGPRRAGAGASTRWPARRRDERRRRLRRALGAGRARASSRRLSFGWRLRRSTSAATSGRSSAATSSRR